MSVSDAVNMETMTLTIGTVCAFVLGVIAAIAFVQRASTRRPFPHLHVCHSVQNARVLKSSNILAQCQKASGEGVGCLYSLSLVDSPLLLSMSTTLLAAAADPFAVTQKACDWSASQNASTPGTSCSTCGASAVELSWRPRQAGGLAPG